MEIRSWGLRKAVEECGFKPVVLNKNAQYEVGKTYWCGYWQKWYKVLDVEYGTAAKYPALLSCTVRWQDGTESTHCTPLDSSLDYELVWPCEEKAG